MSEFDELAKRTPDSGAWQAPFPTSWPFGFGHDAHARRSKIMNQQQRDILRFSNGIANTGDGPWALRPDFQPTVTNAIQEIRR